jgi:hypothetical protein
LNNLFQQRWGHAGAAVAANDDMRQGKLVSNHHLPYQIMLEKDKKKGLLIKWL